MINLYFTVCLLGLLSDSCTKKQPPPTPANNGKTLAITIDLNDEKQTMHSFGASDAWNIKYIGKNWPVEKRNEIADLLFSKEFDANGNPKGIGLSLWRFFIGAGSLEQGANSGIEREFRREECFLKSDGSYDWTKQQGQQWFLHAARQRGVNYLLGFTCSPPVYLTKNGKAYGLDGKDTGRLNLLPENYYHFADFLGTVTNHFKEKGINIDYLSPFNEPQWNWLPSNPTTEGTAAQNEEIFEVTKFINARLAGLRLPTKIVIGECAAHNYLYKPVTENEGRSDVINSFWNSSSPHYLGIFPNVEKAISGHSYFSNGTVEDLVANRQLLMKKIDEAGGGLNFWQTEYCILGNEDKLDGNKRDLGIDPALHIARVIHNDLVLANAVSWQWWLGVSPSDYKDGLVYISDKNGSMGELDAIKADGTIHPSKMLWAFGNFSRFVRPGMIRIASSIESISDPRIAASSIMISSYKDTDKKNLVVVLINMKNEPQKLMLPKELKHLNKPIKSYTTSNVKNLELTILNSIDEITLEKRSVMTLVSDIP